ncbi:MAG: hypothetical protein J1F06_03810 [Prevotellaceae bacterium]|nr:hypothetical protein [Prevotellaceae bacterium]
MKKLYVTPAIEVEEFFVRNSVMVNASDDGFKNGGNGEGLEKPEEGANPGTGFDANKKAFGTGSIWD